jgi:hypothetical protein
MIIISLITVLVHISETAPWTSGLVPFLLHNLECSAFDPKLVHFCTAEGPVYLKRKNESLVCPASFPGLGDPPSAARVGRGSEAGYSFFTLGIPCIMGMVRLG